MGGHEGKGVEGCRYAGGNWDDRREAAIFVYLHVSPLCPPSHGPHLMTPHNTALPPQALHQLREACSSQVMKALARRRGKGEAQDGSSSSGRAAGKSGLACSRRSDWGALSEEDVLATVDQQAGEQPWQVAAVAGVTIDAAGLAATIRVVSASAIDGPSIGSTEQAGRTPQMMPGFSSCAKVMTEAAGNAKVMASLTRAAEVASGLRKLAGRQAQALAERQTQTVAWAKAAGKLQTSGSSSISRAEVVSGGGSVRIMWEILRALLVPHIFSWQPLTLLLGVLAGQAIAPFRAARAAASCRPADPDAPPGRLTRASAPLGDRPPYQDEGGELF